MWVCFWDLYKPHCAGSRSIPSQVCTFHATQYWSCLTSHYTEVCVYVCVVKSLSVLTAIFLMDLVSQYHNVWILSELRMMEVVVTTAAIRCAKLQIVISNKWTPSWSDLCANKLCRRPPQYAPAPCKLTFDLLNSKVVSESRVTWATSVPILVFLGLSVLDLGPMYMTDRQTSDVWSASSLNAPYLGEGHNNVYPGGSIPQVSVCIWSDAWPIIRLKYQLYWIQINENDGLHQNINCCVRGGHKPARWPWPTSQASCDRLTENVCAVLFAYSYAVRHTHFHDVTHGTHVFG